MLECVGECFYSKGGQCTNIKSLSNNRCMLEENQMKLTYTEEQPEHTQDKESGQVNYEKEYYKLKKENEEHIEHIQKLQQELKEVKYLYYNSSESELRNEIENLKGENTSSNATTIELYKEMDQIVEERNNYKETAESQNKRLTELEKRLSNQGIRIKTDGNQIQKLFKEIEEQKVDNEKLRKANATNYDEYKESLQMLKRENEELKRLHENQRLNIKSEMSENRELKAAIQEGIKSVKECGEALKDKNKKIEILKEYIIKLTELI